MDLMSAAATQHW